METTESIVEAYVRYIKGWPTIPNIPCKGQFEIDLLAINPLTLVRYHIESSVSVSDGFSKLTNDPFSNEMLKQRVQAPSQRRTLGYFIERKFGAEGVLETLKKYGFEKNNYTRVIVSWGWTNEAEKEAQVHNIELWDFRNLIKEIAQTFKGNHGYFKDDTLRTLQLFARASEENKAP